MAYDVRVERVASIPLAVVRRRTRQQELPKVVPEACGAVWNVVRAEGIPGAGRHVAVYLDDQINLEVGVELATPLAHDYGDVVGSATPTGLVVTTTHFGPYGLLRHAHEAIQRWRQQQGQKLAGPSWEIYGHWQEEWNRDPVKIVTEVFYLLVDDGGSTG